MATSKQCIVVLWKMSVQQLNCKSCSTPASTMKKKFPYSTFETGLFICGGCTEQSGARVAVGGNNIKTLLTQRRVALRNLMILLLPAAVHVPLCSVHPPFIKWVVSDACKEYVLSYHESDLLKILRSEDKVQHFSITLK
jgi:hypothetical protein